MVELFLIFLSFIAHHVYIWLINANVIVTPEQATLSKTVSRAFYLGCLTYICLWHVTITLPTLSASR